ncbi:MAG: hypothetical protein K2G22_01785 [Eubacterium sp.]|nr:hypothetical protein [Eubacterium sp.]
MINAERMMPDFIELITADEYFKDIQVTRAYPGVIKPTLLKNAVVAVGIKEINVEDSSLGENVKTGSISVFANIYVPYSFDKSNFEKIVFRICSNVAEFNIVSVNVSEITANSASECFVMKAVFTFNNELCFRNDEDE